MSYMMIGGKISGTVQRRVVYDRTTVVRNDMHTRTISFYRAMHYSAKRGLAIPCHLSVCPSVTLMDQDHIS